MSHLSRQPDGFVTETTNLLEKSLSHNSLASHEELQKDLEVQLHSLTKNGSDAKSLFATKRKLLCVSLGAFFAVLILGTLHTSNLKNDCHASERLGWSNDERDRANVIPIVDDHSPLSMLDPVRHLQLAEHGRDRSDPSFPSYYYGTDEHDPKSGKPFQALPTNAWYQNLLQAPQYGEPSNLQRIYPGPYLLDVVGIIPGLRIHGTDTVSSDMVMQLSFDEKNSLVLGATASILDESSQKSTNRYNVLRTTDLGITLEWVS